MKYEKEYHSEKHNNLYKNNDYYLARAKIAKEDYFKGIVKKDEKVLEYGCGLGQNIFLINNCVGYDISQFALKFCREKGIRVVNDLSGLKRYGKFNVALCCQVLEHIEKPLRVLKEINAQLKEQGKLILVLPLDKWNKPNINDTNQHLYNWNFNTITNLLIRGGFYPINYKIMRRTGFKKLMWSYKINLRFYLFLTKLVAILFGSKHMLIIAQKK